jgi:ubiquinone/menaquinone biosynthesis C-methylase UbiE
VLDVGCGSGYFTVELARRSALAVGIDTNPFLQRIRVPPSLQHRLRFVHGTGESIPYPAEQFDRVLASEVLPMVTDPVLLMREICRVLKPGGRLVIVNGTALAPIRDAYANGARRLRQLQQQHGDRFPDSYDEYVAIFHRILGIPRQRFLSEDELTGLDEGQGLTVEEVKHSPRRIAGDWMAWRQFRMYLRSGVLISSSNFVVPFLALSLVSRFDTDSYRGGAIIVAKKP